MRNFLIKILFFCHRIIRGLGNRVMDKNIYHHRKFSNNRLRLYADFFSGSVINVSGWDDNDGEGGFYKQYFKFASDYTISNGPTKDKGYGSAIDGKIKEIAIDLNKPIATDLYKKYDVVFNHTTLEHIVNIQTAFKNLCDLSRDVVVLVVPAIQQIHICDSYGDYWRMTTLGVAKMFKENNFMPLIISCNDQPFAPIYCFAIAVANPEKYKNIIIQNLNFEMGTYLYGSSLKKRHLKNLLNIEV